MSRRPRPGAVPTLPEIERWMIRSGAPMMLRRPRREHPTLARTLPFVAAYVMAQAPLALGLWALFRQGINVVDPTAKLSPFVSITLGGLIAAGAIWGPLAFWAMIRLQRRFAGLYRRRAGYLGAAVGLGVLVALNRRPGQTLGEFATASAWDVATILVAAYLVRVGAVAVVEASLRGVVGHVREMGRLGTRALPLLLVFVTFLFVNTENWQMSSSLEGTDLWMVIGFFLVVAGLFMLVRLPEEIAHVDVEITPEALRLATAGTPLGAALAERSDDELTGEPTPLKRRERANLVGLLLARQAVQAVLMGVVVFAFFAAFGRIAIKPSVIESWVGAPPSPIELFPDLLSGNISLPFSLELAKVSVVLAAFSALYFTVFGVTDPTYREQFFQRMLTKTERVLLVREAYLRVTDPRVRDDADQPAPDVSDDRPPLPVPSER
jgi:hypothetical protein